MIERAKPRAPDFVIGGWDNPYMLRWWITPWSGIARTVPDADKTWWQWLISKMPGIYLHYIVRSDDDRALHDHPWCNLSVLLRGRYIEHTIAAGGIHIRTVREAGEIVFRRARCAHRLEITRHTVGSPTDPKVYTRVPEPCWSLFMHGFRFRHWGFHCPRGWVHWRKFTAANDPGSIGKGCGA
jgi:hypothetical protein